MVIIIFVIVVIFLIWFVSEKIQIVHGKNSKEKTSYLIEDDFEDSKFDELTMLKKNNSLKTALNSLFHQLISSPKYSLQF